MPVWAWILIAIGAVIVLGVIAWQLVRQQRTRKLRDEFGPEYQRTVSSADSKREAEAELAARKERRGKLDIRPLSAEERARYTEEWQAVQAQFVDDPQGAVMRSDSLIQSVMADRGYPMEDFEQRAADVSVDHPRVVENYREGHRLFQRTSAGDGTTEDLRQAMRAYRKLFVELVDEGDPDADLAEERQAAEARR
jgi:cytoskeletal protein RodZ